MFRKRQQIVICVAAGAMLVGFVLFRYLPLRKRLKAIELQYSVTQLAIAKASAERGQVPALKKQLKDLQVTVGNYEAGVPVERAVGPFLQRIADLMDMHNLGKEGQLIEPGKEIEADELTCIPVNIECKGKLTQLFEFYKSLQRLDRLVRIERIKLVNDRDFGGEVSMATKAMIYYR